MPRPRKPAAIEVRQAKQKTDLIEQLRKTPIIQVVCERLGIGRATYYRWRKEDEAFSLAAEQAVHDGASLINDMAESQLIAAIRDRNLTAIIFWLKHHHANYATRIELSGHLKHSTEILTDEQAQLVMEALRLSALLPNKEHHELTKQQ